MATTLQAGNQPSRPSVTWAVVALLACVSTATMVLLLKYAGNCIDARAESHADKTQMLITFMAGYIAVAGILCVFVMALRTQYGNGRHLLNRLCADRRLCLVLLAVAATILLSQTGIIMSVNMAPNPGYAHMIINMNVIIVLLLSVLLFGNMISPTSALGIAFAVFGILLVVNGST